MNNPRSLTQSNRCRAITVAVGLAALAAGLGVGGLAGLLLVMGGLVPIGAAVANVAVITSARETLRQWQPAPDERQRPRATNDERPATSE
jgi:hypothetical protein